MRRLLALACLMAALLAAGCTKPTKDEILQKTKEVRVARDLRAALGSPDDVEALAMFEQWTYECQDGAVVFHIANEKIIFRDTIHASRSK